MSLKSEAVRGLTLAAFLALGLSAPFTAASSSSMTSVT